MKREIKRLLMDGYGRIILPADIRDAIGAEAGDSFLVAPPQDRIIELRLAKMNVCIFCKSAVFLTQTNMGYICKSCLNKFLARYLLHGEEEDEKKDTGK